MVDVGGTCLKLMGKVLKRDWWVVRLCFGNEAELVAEMQLNV